MIAPANYAGQGYYWARAAERNPRIAAVNMVIDSINPFQYPADNPVPGRIAAHSHSWQKAQYHAIVEKFTHMLIEAEMRPLGSAYGRDLLAQAHAIRDGGVGLAMVCHGNDIRLPMRHASLEKWSPFVDDSWVPVAALEKIVKSNLAVLRELNTLAMKSRVNRHEALLGDIYGHMISLAGTVDIKTEDLLSRIVSGNYYRSAYDLQKGMGVAFNIAKLDEGTVRGILQDDWSGKNFSKTIWDNTDKLAITARRELSLGFIRGDSIQQMASAINKTMGAGYQNAKRLVITESSHAANQGELRSLDQNGFTRYTYMAGAGTVDYCIDLNGKNFRLDEAKEGVNIPPMHPNCRCCIVACFEGFWDGGSKMPFPHGMNIEDWQQKFTL
jgi:SPP1 gp7 family putative phage head morphogenesis protein